MLRSPPAMEVSKQKDLSENNSAPFPANKREKLPLFSIIIPVKNGQDTIGKLLDSIFLQDYNDFEVIAVDDGSTDNTSEILSQYPIRVLRSEVSLGAGLARNRGASEAQGEILVFFDSDVILLPGVLSRMTKCFTQDGMNVMGGIYALEPANNGWYQRYKALVDFFWHKDISKNNCFAARCGAIRKSLFLREGGFRVFSGASVECEDLGHRLMDRYPIYILHGIQVLHHFPGLKKGIKDLFKRSFAWSSLFIKRKRFDNVATTSRNAIATALAPLSILMLAASIFTPWAPLGASALFLLYLIANGKFFAFILKNTRWNPFFFLYSLIVSFIIANVVTVGATLGFIYALINKITGGGFIVRFIQSYLSRGPQYLIVFLTDRCNQKCLTCFYHDRGDAREMDLYEISQLASGAGRIFQLTLSGGEPFLRKDIVDICRIFHERCRPFFITIPTNGMMPELIRDTFKEIIAVCPDSHIKAVLSIDAIGNLHDFIRGVEGAFSKVMETYQLIKQLEGLTIVVNTVVSSYNEDNILYLIRFIHEKMEVDYLSVCLLRGNPRDIKAPIKDINNFRSAVMEVERLYSLKRISRVSLMDAISRTVRHVILKSTAQGQAVVPCLAADRLMVVDHEGTIFPGEILTDSLGSIRKGDTILGISSSKKCKEIRTKIRETECFCTFECALVASLAYSPIRYLQVLRHIFNKKNFS